MNTTGTKSTNTSSSRVRILYHPTVHSLLGHHHLNRTHSSHINHFTTDQPSTSSKHLNCRHALKKSHIFYTWSDTFADGIHCKTTQRTGASPPSEHIRVYSLRGELPVARPLTHVIQTSDASTIPAEIAHEIKARAQPLDRPLFYTSGSQDDYLPVEISTPTLHTSTSTLTLTRAAAPRITTPRFLVSE